MVTRVKTHRAVVHEHADRRRAALRLPHLDVARSRVTGASSVLSRARRPAATGEPARGGTTGRRAPRRRQPVTVTGPSPTPAGDRCRSRSPSRTGRSPTCRRRVPERERQGPADQRPRAAGPGAGDPRRAERRHRHGQRRHGHQRGLPRVAAVRARRGRAVSAAPGRRAARRGTSSTSWACRSAWRCAAGTPPTTPAAPPGPRSWRRCARSTGCSAPTGADSCVSRLGRGELTLADCPPEVAEVLALGEEAERELRRRVRRAPHRAGRARRPRPQRRGEGLGRRAGRARRCGRCPTPTSACPPAATWSAAPLDPDGAAVADRRRGPARPAPAGRGRAGAHRRGGHLGHRAPRAARRRRPHRPAAGGRRLGHGRRPTR